jgi:predicted metal-binding membrane protein
MMETSSPWTGGALLLAAGIYQFTPLKATCLRACQSPLSFIMQRWRAGTLGAFRMGADHGRYCLGCCWALMLLLFVGGVMNLWVIVALTAFVLIEKLAPFGVHSARLAGVALIALAVWMFVP